MPRLNDRKNDYMIPTYMRLPRATRAELESAIGWEGIRTLTDAVAVAARLLAKQVKKKPKPAS